MSFCPSIQKLTSIPASVLQNVTNKSCLLGAKSIKYAFLLSLRPLQGPEVQRESSKAELLSYNIRR